MDRRSVNYVQEQIKQAPIWVVVLVLVVGSINQSEHNQLIREQIEQIHEAQVMQIREGRKFEERMTEKTNILNFKIAKLELQNEMWEIPIYNNPATDKTYVDGRE